MPVRDQRELADALTEASQHANRELAAGLIKEIDHGLTERSDDELCLHAVLEYDDMGRGYWAPREVQDEGGEYVADVEVFFSLPLEYAEDIDLDALDEARAMFSSHVADVPDEQLRKAATRVDADGFTIRVRDEED